jgi:hypothetical protein
MPIIQEPDGNIVLRISPTFAVRLYNNQNYALTEVWYDTKPGPITDPFRGESFGHVYDINCADCTQMGAGSYTPNYAVNNPYSKITKTNDTLTIEGSYPTFWISEESIDTLFPDGPECWATRYSLPNKWAGAETTSFVAINGINESVCFPRDTLNKVQAFEYNLGKFREGLVGASTKVYLRNAQSGFGGIVFRLTPIFLAGSPTHQNVLKYPQYSFVVTKDGKWQFKYQSGIVAQGTLSSVDKTNLNNNNGLKVEVRSNPNIPHLVQFYISNIQVHQAYVPSYEDCYGAGLTASCNTGGKVDFDSRDFRDLSIKSVIQYQIIENSHLTVDYQVISTGFLEYEPFNIYRNVFGAFLNRALYPTRSTQILRKGQTAWEEFDGVIQLRDISASFAGAPDGSSGIKIVPLMAGNTMANGDSIDPIANGDAHTLISKRQINDSFVSHINACKYGVPTSILSSILKFALFNRRDS